ncbi:hypothetical protein C8R46DRAFT_997952 [Mycena filopes]|nr:hypothetical protein C8R46DRAFT_997952 [Mycena filopes]
MDTISQRLNVVSDSLQVLAYMGGVHAVKPDDLVLYYDLNDDSGRARRINFATATEQDLATLEEYCETITSEGHNDVPAMNVKTLAAGFSTRFDVAGSGLLNAISGYLLEGINALDGQSLRAEMGDLTVYAPGAFMKPTKSTTHGEGMVGSLVIIFPTTCTGGTLSLVHQQPWTFTPDIPTNGTPVVGYVLFRSDVMQAVEPVLSGHRVTHTFNIFLAPQRADSLATHRILPAPERTFEDTLRPLLVDPAFLPAGGFLVYGLAHKYHLPLKALTPLHDPVTYKPIKPASRLIPLLGALQGRDERVRAISVRAGLQPELKLLYDTEDGYMEGRDVLVDEIVDLSGVHEGIPGFDDMDEESGTAEKTIEEEGVVLLRGPERVAALKERITRTWVAAGLDPEAVLNGGWNGGNWNGGNPTPRFPGWDEYEQAEMGVAVHWMAKVEEGLNRVRSEYIREDGMIENMYGDAVLVVSVPAFGVGIRAA